MKLGQQLQLQRRVLLLGMETGGIPHGSGKMTMKAAKTKLGQKTGLKRFGLSTGTNESEGMTHLPSMASGMPSLDRVETLKGWSGTSSASALATTDGLGDCMHFARSEKKLGYSHAKKLLQGNWQNKRPFGPHYFQDIFVFQ